MATTGLAIAMLASVSPAPVGGQQTGLIDDNTYVFALDGMVVEWGGTWEFDSESSDQDVGVEFANLLSPLAVLLIGELQGGAPLDLNQFLALVLDGIAEDADEFVTVDRSATDTVSYSLDAAVIDGIPAGLFTYIQPNAVTGTILFTSILAEASTFASSVADAQANVTVDGRIALEGIDGAALQSLLPDVVATPGDSILEEEDSDADEEDVADEEGPDTGEDDVDDEDRPADRTRPSFGDNAGPSENEDDADDARSEQGNDDQEQDDGGNDADLDLVELGLVDDGLYESPQFGTEIEWSNDWTPNPELISSNEDDEVDNLGLNNEGGALVLVTIFEAGDATPADFAAFWESDDFLEENASDEAEVLLSDSTDDESAVLIVDTLEGGGELWALRQAYSLDGGDTIAIVLMLSLAEDFPDNLEAAQDGIGIDGNDALSLFSIDDIEDAA
jgi:hypothetical protein